MTTDLIGSALRPAEERLLAVYDELRAMLRDEELAPTTRANIDFEGSEKPNGEPGTQPRPSAVMSS